MTLKSTLIAARKRIATLETWTQGDHAIENTGAPVNPLSPKACAWCADGAILRVTRTAPEGDFKPAYSAASHALMVSAKKLYPRAHGIVEVNDGEALADTATETDCHAAVLRVFDDAIATA